MKGTWTRTEIAGKPTDVYEPPATPGADATRLARFGVLYLHPFGLETLVGNTAFTRLFDELRLACVDRKSTRLNSSHRTISYAVFCLKKKKKKNKNTKIKRNTTLVSTK